MKNKILQFLIVPAILIMALISGCYYDEVVPVKPKPPLVPPEFSADIIPIFNESCNTSGCHGVGDIPPDLTPNNAYNSLISGNFVNTNDPESSLLYEKIAPGGSMELYSSPQKTALILAWIKDGAQNN